MDLQAHWEKVYNTNPPEKVGWYRPHLETSLNWIRNLPLDKKACIIDVGGGVSTLVDDLLAEGFGAITVVDLSRTALNMTRQRLGKLAAQVAWMEGDITALSLPPDHFDLWHDRAVFHFLTTPEQRQKYLSNLIRSLKPGGYLIMATFSLEAPPRCSGLPVERYSVEKLEDVLGPRFQLEQHTRELHITPGGVEQMYLYCQFRKIG